jgi:large subunit ribosomal protein L15
MPLQRRVPKFGFTNINRKEYEGVNLDTLQLLVDNGVITDTVDGLRFKSFGY